jgi:hypothetical protein
VLNGKDETELAKLGNFFFYFFLILQTKRKMKICILCFYCRASKNTRGCFDILSRGIVKTEMQRQKVTIGLAKI